MKKITLLCFALIAGFALQAQNFTSETTTGTTVYNSEAGTTTQQINGQSATPMTITQSNSQTIEAGAEIACASPTSFRNNSMWRDFDLSFDHGITGDWYVTDVEVAIGPVSTPAGFPLTVNIYSTAPGDFPGSLGDLIGSGIYLVTNADAETIVSVPVTGMVPEGMNLTVEAQITDDGTDTNFMRFGCNNDGEIGPSYIQAADCGATVPTAFADLGLTQGMVMNVVGDDEEPLSVGENLSDLISVYPNPVSSRLNVEMPSNIEVKSAAIYDLLGKNTGAVLVNGVMNTTNLARGVYILNVETSAGTLTQKVVKN